MNAQRVESAAIPKALVILALLAVGDGITTHIGLTFGATEVNPLLAALYAVHPLVGEAFRVAIWMLVIAIFWRAYRSPSCRRGLLNFCLGSAIAIEGIIVGLNTAQLALLWWLWSLA